MSDDPANRTIGFRARLSGRMEALLAQATSTAARRAEHAGLAGAALERLVTPYEGLVTRLVRGLVSGKPMQQAVLDRAWLAEHWSLHDRDGCDEDLERALLEASLLEQAEGWSPAAPFWPSNVSPDDLVQALRATRDPDALLLADLAADGLFFPREQDGGFGVDARLYGRRVQARSGLPAPLGERPWSDEMLRALGRWPIVPCARVVAASKMVLADLRKPAIAIDTGRVHHELMTGWSRAAREGTILLEQKPDHVELFLPGAEHKPARLMLPLDDERLSQAFVEAIKEWRSFLGLRHWIALQSLFSIQGKREGRVLWKLEDHLDALGVSKRWREDPKNRASVVREVSLLSKMQLVVYRPDGTVRARHNVLLTTAEIDVERGGEWLLEGLELQMHPWLYNGVRDQKTGQLGKHWYPVPPELAKVDHDKFRYALILGLMLPIRWKWAWAQGTDHIALAASKLLELACIEPTRLHPGRAWDGLEANLAELERIGLLGHVRWEGERRTSAAKVYLYPADWLIDRTVQGLHPVEKALPPPLPTRGTDLIAWRKARRLTQAQLAKLWGVGERTIRRAEDDPDKPLGRALLTALKTLPRDPSLTPEVPEVEAAPAEPPAGDEPEPAPDR